MATEWHNIPNDPSFNKDWSDIRHWFGDKRHFRPWYDDDADYNTNAKSYYDFLARFIRQLDTMIGLINKLLAQDIATTNTPAINLKKAGDWQAGHVCNGEWVYDDGENGIETLTATLILSMRELNSANILNDGLYVKDLQPQIDDLQKQINDINNKINNMQQQINKQADYIKQLQNGLYQLLRNLQTSGAFTPSTTGNPSGDLPNETTLQKLFNGDLNTGRNLATGNINFFGGTQDGSSFIRTNSGSTENDVTAGV